MRHSFLALLVLSLAACPECPSPGPGDAGGGGTTSSSSSSSGASGSSSSGVVGDGGVQDGGPSGGDGGTGCGPNTEGFGEPCGDCGAMLCNQQGELACADPGKNACDACGELDTSNGIVGRECGSCGIVGCADGGLATVCTGEHPPNACGGCLDFPDGKGPPDAGCSECNTGRWRCQVSLNDLSCWEGRGTDTSCGDCQRCIRYTADMSDLSQGAYILAGTRAIIEDVGADTDMGTSPTSTHVLTFDPLILGPGGAVMEGAIVFLSPSDRHDDPNAFALPEFFSAYDFGQPGDPVRQFHIDFDLDQMNYVIIYDGFLDQVVSRGELIPSSNP
ncbi:MAG: hypothetical protein AB2A00_33210 [Myxococcota bacterium]